MKKYLFALVSLLASSMAFATPDRYWSASSSTGQINSTSLDYVCHEQYNRYVAGNPNIGPTSYLGAYGVTDTSATCKGLYSNAGSSFTVGTASHVTCPTTYPYFNGTSCVVTPPPPPPAECTASSGPNIEITVAWATGPAPGSAYASRPFPAADYYAQKYCYQGCLIKPDMNVATPKMYHDDVQSPNGFYRVFSGPQPTERIGGSAYSCTGKNDDDPRALNTEPPKPAVPAEKNMCPFNSVPIGQDSDGLTICKGTTTQPPTSSSTTTTTPKTTTTDASGNTVDTISTTTTNSDGSSTTTTTTTTTKPDGTKSTSVSSNTTAATSGQPGTTDKPQEQKDMCALHPELTVCRNSQVIGSCEQVTCTGDAIQCATLRAAATMQCQQQRDNEALVKMGATSLGNSIIGGSDPSQGAIDAMKTGSEVNLSNPNLDQTGFLGGGACLAPMTMTVLGRSFTYSFDGVCANIQPLRSVIMLLAFICAYLIVSRSVLQS